MKSNFGILLGFFLLLTSAGGSFAQNEPELIFPVDHSYLTEKTVRVIGLVPLGQQQVTLAVEGGKIVGGNTLTADKGAFTFIFKLAKGANRISVMKQDGSGAASSLNLFYGSSSGDVPSSYVPYQTHESSPELTANCEDCHLFRRQGTPAYNRLKPETTCSTQKCHPGFAQKKYLHGPIGIGSCTGCHNPHGSTQDVFLAREGKALCFSCHSDEGEMFTGKTVHQPVADDDCLSCHDPHQSDVKFQLKSTSQEALCGECHGDDRSQHKYLHGPVGTGNCVACHNPHASNHASLLHEQEKDLCFLCHQDRKEEFSRKYVHAPIEEGCGVCHEPHGSETRHQLKSTIDMKGYGQTAPCLSCHMELNPELSRNILNAKVGHKPVRDGNCTACHTPHASNYEFQLKAPVQELCFTCHLEMGEVVPESPYKHGPVATNDCAVCHNVHGEAHTKLLSNDFPAEFYTSYATEKYAICFDCHNDTVALDKWSKETQFRNGNRNLHFVHVNRQKGRNCKACHEVHAGSQERHIRENIPFGSKGWSYPIQYTATETGGGCIVGCHRPLEYDRKKAIKY
ncbi:MAG: cytochrome c3 family protein [Desulfuromonadales bacterium]|nr:cytochrome c3 family protein [Desulfuromonadales bacterium]